VNNLPKVLPESGTAGSRTRDLCVALGRRGHDKIKTKKQSEYVVVVVVSVAGTGLSSDGRSAQSFVTRSHVMTPPLSLR